MNNSSKKANKPINHRRTLSRLMAIQIFYQYNFLEASRELDEIKDDVIENYALDFEEDAT